MRSIIERSREIYNYQNSSHSKDSYNETLHIWRLRDGRMIEFGSLQHDKDVEKYRGRPHDFYGWDELPEFPESFYRFVNGWLRSTRAGQRCRIIATGNPPTNQEGRWVIKYWAPWLDPEHPNPALPGELRWFAMVDGEDVERPEREPFIHNGELITPLSRTFIPASLKDNPYLEATGYRSRLQGMPEPLRSQLLYGDFSIGVSDDPWQVIPTKWVQLANDRWNDTVRPDGPMSAVGVDVAHGGKDYTVLAKRWGSWYDELERYPGVETATGQIVAAKVSMALTLGGYANLDGIGVGTSAYDQLSQGPVAKRVHSVIFSEGARDWQGKPVRDRTGTLEFANMRAYAWWMFREMLDPDNGYEVALPPDSRLLADLTTPRWEMRLNKVLIESKEDIAKRLGGRSTDDGDAVVLSALPVQVPPTPAIPTYVVSSVQRAGSPFGRK